MRDRFCMVVMAALGAGCWLLTASAHAARAEQIRFQDRDFIAYWVNLKTDELVLCWRDPQGQQLGTFSRLREHLAEQSREVRFAINAGIHSATGEPLGLHVEGTNALRGLNLGELQDGQYNFYLKPNGVFHVTGLDAAIVEAEAFSKLKLRPALACQSGPLLLERGRIHHAFRPQSTNYHWRSGVGVTKGREVVFVLSRQALRFYDFAVLFRDRLNCTDALYLDGDICGIYLPELGYKEDARSRFAGMFAVTVPASAAR